MTFEFTKIRLAGDECILITIKEKWKECILILDKYDIENLNKTWRIKQNDK